MKRDFYFGPHQVAATEWAVEKPKAIVQIVHGMIDHIGTYDEFAQFLNQAGYLVVGNDHMGHGATVSEAEEYGRFARDWTCLVEDVHDLHQEMKQRYPELPYFLMGHSMGSFITRAFLAKYGHEIDGAIIMSTGQLPLYQSRAAILIGHLIRFFKGGDYASPLLHYFSTGRLNHAYAPNKTDGDWLSRDEAAVARSLGDSKRQFVPSVNMSLGIFHLANLVAQQATIDQIPRSLPLLLIAGDGDPLGNFGKGIRQLEERIARHHEGTLKTILYPGARHELLVETNKAEVMNDLLNWLNVTIQAENPTIQAVL